MTDTLNSNHKTNHEKIGVYTDFICENCTDQQELDNCDFIEINMEHNNRLKLWTYLYNQYT